MEIEEAMKRWEEVERKRWRCGGKLDSWPPGGIRLGARVCFSMCVLSATLPSSYELRFP